MFEKVPFASGSHPLQDAEPHWWSKPLILIKENHASDSNHSGRMSVGLFSGHSGTQI